MSDDAIMTAESTEMFSKEGLAAISEEMNKTIKLDPAKAKSPADIASEQFRRQETPKPASTPAATPPREPQKPSVVKPVLDKKPVSPPKTEDKTPAPITDEEKKTASNWEKAKESARLEERERLTAFYESQLAEARKSVGLADKETVATITKERDEAQQRLRAFAIERDPQFEKDFNDARNNIHNAAKSTVPPELASQLQSILEMPSSQARDNKINELMSSDKMPPWRQAQLGAALLNLNQLEMAKESKINQSRENWKKEMVESQAREERMRQQKVQVLDNTIKAWQGPQGLAVLQKKEGDNEWNSQVDEAIQTAHDIFNGNLNDDSMARAALWGATAHLLLKSNEGLASRLAEVENENKTLKGLQPGSDPKTTGDSSGGSELPPDVDWATAVAIGMQREGYLK